MWPELWKKAFFCGALLVIALGLGAQAQAVSRQDILKPIENDLAQCKAALAEVDRQADLRKLELSERLAFLEARQQDIQLAEERMREEFSARKKALDRAVLAGWQLVTELEDKIHLPRFGFVTIQELRDRREAQIQDMQQKLEMLENGEYVLQVAGLGLLTRQELGQRIAEASTALLELDKVVEAGKFAIHYPGLGKVDRKRLAAHKDILEERIKTTSEEIKAGDYVIVLPHLGPVSRNSLQQRIDGLQEQKKNLKQNFKDGRQRILRASIQWSEATRVSQQLAALQEKQKQLRQELKDKQASYFLPIGWSKAEDIQAQLKAIQTEKDDVERKLSDNTYEVALPDGTWANEQELDKALLNAVIAPDIRKRLEQGRKNIAVTARLEQELYGLEAEKLKGWLEKFSSLADPERALLELEEKWKKAMLTEFTREEKEALRWIDARLRWLERQKRYLP